MRLGQWRMKAAALTAALALLAGGLAACTDGAGVREAIEMTGKATGSEPGGAGGAGGANAVEPAEPEDNEQLIAEFAQAVEQAGSASDIRAFIEANIEAASTGDADAMIRELLAYYERTLYDVQERFYEPGVQEELLQSAIWPITADNAGKLANEAVRRLVETTLTAGYKLEAVEGSIYPVVDYESITKLGGRVSGEVADFVAIKAMESNERTASDGAIAIGWDELAERVIAAENYLRTYPDSAHYAEVKQLFENYMTVYLQGLDNTPIYDYDSLLLLKEVEASYRKLIGENPGTASAEIVRGYLRVLDEAGGKVMTGSGADLRVMDKIEQYRSDLPLQIGGLLDE